MSRALRASLAALVLGAAAHAGEVSGNFKWMNSGAKQPNAPGTFQSYQETNAAYGLPGGIRATSFLDVYADTSNTYYAKSTFAKKIAGNLNAALQTRSYQEPFTDAGLGAKLNIPIKNGYAAICAFPVWIDKRGHQEEKSTAVFVFGKDLGHGFNFETFGEMKYAHSHTKWNYGELELTKKVGPFKIGYSGALQPSGKTIPKLEHRGVIRYDWKFGGKK